MFRSLVVVGGERGPTWCKSRGERVSEKVGRQLIAKGWLLMGSLLAGLWAASCPDHSLFDFGAHFSQLGSHF